MKWSSIRLALSRLRRDRMARKRHTAEEIVAKLRQVDVLTSQGRPVAEAVRSIGVTEVTYYRWRQEYGGLKGDQVKRPSDGPALFSASTDPHSARSPQDLMMKRR